MKFNPIGGANSLFTEFKAFAFKGNVIDLAVGVIIGAAFGAIVNSLVKNIIMPIVGIVTPGGGGYQSWYVTVHGSIIPYGAFLGDVVNFVVVAAALFFFIVKFLGWVMRSRKEEPAVVPPPPAAEVILLTEIRDLLKSERTPQ